MSPDWLPWTVYAPAPFDHAGYSFFNISPQVEKKYGVVIHSAGGNFGPGNMPHDIMVAAGNSWHCSIFKDGRVQIHYPSPLWVAWASGGPMQNLLLWAVEMDGYHHEPWTPEQTASLKRVLKETWDYGPPKWANAGFYDEQELIKDGVLEWGQNLWDHGWLSPTDCPSGRNDAHRQEIIDWLEEGDMTDWPLEKAKLSRDFEAWLAYYPLTDAEKNDSARQMTEDALARRFFGRQISWRLPAIGS